MYVQLPTNPLELKLKATISANKAVFMQILHEFIPLVPEFCECINNDSEYDIQQDDNYDNKVAHISDKSKHSPHVKLQVGVQNVPDPPPALVPESKSVKKHTLREVQ